MEDTPVVAPSNSLSHAPTPKQPPDGCNEAIRSEIPRRSVPMLASCSDTDDDEEDALRRGAFDYYVSTSKHVAAVAALGKKPIEPDAKHLNDDTLKDDDVSPGDSLRSDSVFDDAKRHFDEEYELEAMDRNRFKPARKSSSRFKTIEDVCNAKTRANNDQQYDERYSVSSAGSTVHSDEDDDDNLVNVNVHERLRDSCYVTIDTDFGDDAMECIDQAKKMTITQPLNSSLSHLAQNYGSTGVHARSHSQAVDAAVSFGALNRAADNATGFSHDLTVASGAANRVHVEKTTYSKRRSPPFGDPVCREKLTHSALQLLPQGPFQSHQVEPQSYKADDAAECSAARKKKKKKKSTSSRGDEVDEGKSQRDTDINGNPVSGPTKKQHSSGRRTDSGSSEPHSRSEMGYEYSDLSSQMSSSSDSRYLEKKAKKAKRERKDAVTTQAKDIPGNRGDQDVEALLNYIENGKKKQHPIGQVNGIATVPLGGPVEQKFSVKKFGYGKGERTGADVDMDSKGSSLGSDGKTGDVFTGSEGSSVSDSVTEIGSVHDAMPKDESAVVCPISGDTYIFTDFDCILPPKEAEFTQVKKKKKRPKDVVVSRETTWHAVCQAELHRKPHVSARSVTPPPASVGSEEVHMERALSPSSFPVLGRSREGRRNSTGNAPPTDGLQDDSDMESVKSVPIGSELGGVLSPRLSHLSKQSYAKIAAASRPGVDNDAIHRAEHLQTHVVNPESYAASVTSARDEDRHNVVIASEDSVKTLSVQNTKQRTDFGGSSAADLSQFSCMPSATVSAPVLSSVINEPSFVLTDSVSTSVTPDDTIAVMKKSAYISLAHIDAKASCPQSSIVCNKSSIDDDLNLQAVSGMDSFPLTKSETSEYDLHGSSIQPKSRATAMHGGKEGTTIHQSVAVVFTGETECLGMPPSHATAAAVQLNDKHAVLETQYSNKNVPHPATSTGAAIEDASVNIVNMNLESSKTVLPQNSIGVTPAGVGGCTRSVVPKASNTRRNKTNKSVIFFDRKLNELPRNLGISFGFGPEDSAQDAGTAGSCNDACMCEANTGQRGQRPRDSSHSLVADTMPSPQSRRGDAADVYMSKVLVPMNGVTLPHTASLLQGAPSSDPEHVHLVNDSPMPSHAAKQGVEHAGQLYSRDNDFNFQTGKFDIEGAVTFLYKEWEKIIKQKPKRVASRVIFYNDNEFN